MLGAFVLVSALLIGATIKRRQNPLYQLSRYPQTPAFKRYVFNVSSEMEIPITPALISIDELIGKDFGEVLESVLERSYFYQSGSRVCSILSIIAHSIQARLSWT